MKKLLLILAMVMLPLSMAIATDYYFVIETGIDLSESDTLKVIGKPSMGAWFTDDSDCDNTSGQWNSGFWQGISYVAVEASSTKSSRLAEAFFVDGSISKGSNLESLDDLGATCENEIEGAVHTFDKFSGQVN